VLIFEPRTEGHHLSYLKAITEDLLSAGYRLTLAIDTRPVPLRQIRDEMAVVLDKATILPLQELFGSRGGKRRIDAVANCLSKSGAELAFMPNFDEVASRMLRSAALGIMPDNSIRGRLAGIYFRPRFLQDSGISTHWLKSVGFRRLLRNGWFRHLFLLDPFLCERLKLRVCRAPVSCIPDPFPGDFHFDQAHARQELNVKPNCHVLLFYGARYPRKGLSVVLGAMESLPSELPAFLLCAGEPMGDRDEARRLADLAAKGRARVIARHISNEEEKKFFAASDVVLLPYLRHFGSSGILARAIGAGKPVIASDEGLIAQFVRDLNIGLLFRSGDVGQLATAIRTTVNASKSQTLGWQASALAAAPKWSRKAFRQALLEGLSPALSRSADESGRPIPRSDCVAH
jgi:glycosyltransferase involved in cell wall biosynthesis